MARRGWRKTMGLAAIGLLAGLAAWSARLAFTSSAASSSSSPASSSAEALSAKTAPLNAAQATGGRDIRRPSPVLLPIASLEQLKTEVSSGPVEAHIPHVAALVADSGGEAEAAEPIRAVAPVSSARDEQSQRVQVPLAAVPGTPTSRPALSPKGRPSQ